MKKKKLNKVKKIFANITYEKILAIIFILFIFFISIAALPVVFTKIGQEFTKKTTFKNKILNTVKVLNKEYAGMLTFEGNFISNKGTYINLNGLMARLMGQREMNDTILLNNGNLMNMRKKLDLNRIIEQMTKLYNKQKEKNKEFLFVLAPSQISKYENLVPEELKKIDYTNYNADKLLEGLEANNVPYLDLREELHKEGIEHKDAFFRTDHHWKIETGFWAYTKVINRLLEDKIILNVDKKHFDLDNYHVDKYENWLLGSSGRRVGKYFAGVDDFPIITPKFDTIFKVEFPRNNMTIQDNFKNALLDKTRNIKDYFSAAPYATYSWGNKELNILNVNAKEKQKLLLLGDSFSRVPLAYLSLDFHEVHKRDMRHFKEFFLDSYEKFDPDIFIVLVGENHIGTSIPVDFLSNNIVDK